MGVMTGFARMRSWFTYNESDPGRMSPTDPRVSHLVARVAAGSHAIDLGGDFSLNVLLEPAGVVLRVHQPFVSRRRMVAAQDVRRWLASMGLIVPLAVSWNGSTALRCDQRWAELETRIEHDAREPSMDSYLWLFGAIGALHRVLGTAPLSVPRPVVATYTPPSTLRRWCTATATAIAGDPDSARTVEALRCLVGKLLRQWVSSTLLPAQVIHGDIHLENVVQTATGEPVYLDFGSLTHAPRVHDLAYALAHMARTLTAHHAPDAFPWNEVPHLVHEYEAAAGFPLTELERQALAPYTAAVPLQYAARAGFFTDPAAILRNALPFLHVSRWLLSHPDTLGDLTPV
jgi:Ser/Thr protein kinase RdoA (MazF antagonist)